MGRLHSYGQSYSVFGLGNTLVEVLVREVYLIGRVRYGGWFRLRQGGSLAMTSWVPSRRQAGFPYDKLLPLHTPTLNIQRRWQTNCAHPPELHVP